MSEWETILQRGFESKELDYKGPCSWDEADKKACCEIVKDIIAVANAKGGFIVIGVSETSSGFSWDGLTDDQCKSFETSRLNRFLQNYTDPPINPHIIKHTSGSKNFVILEVPSFPDTPHICQKDYPGVLSSGAVYIRTDNNESAAIRDSSDMRAIVERAVRNRSDQLMTSFRAILTGTPDPGRGASDLQEFSTQARDAATRSWELVPKDLMSLGFRETVIHPAQFTSHRFTVPDLEQAAEGASVTYRGWPYLFYSQRREDCITHLEDGLEMWLPSRVQFWRIYQSGCVYINELFHEDQSRETRGEKVLGTNGFAYTSAEAVKCLVNLFTGRLPDDELVRLQLRLRGVQGRKLGMPRGTQYSVTPYECQADQIVYDRQEPLADWRAGVVENAVDIVRAVSKKFGVPDSSREDVRALVRELLDRQIRSE